MLISLRLSTNFWIAPRMCKINANGIYHNAVCDFSFYTAYIELELLSYHITIIYRSYIYQYLAEGIENYNDTVWHMSISLIKITVRYAHLVFIY